MLDKITQAFPMNLRNSFGLPAGTGIHSATFRLKTMTTMIETLLNQS